MKRKGPYSTVYINAQKEATLTTNEVSDDHTKSTHRYDNPIQHRKLHYSNNNN
jgi:hypothetical protein